MEVRTYGCAVNQADTEIIKGLLKMHGLFSIDVVVVNTCTVKSPTENKILKLLRQLRKEGRKVVVAGCLPAARKSVVAEFPEFSFIGVNTKDIVDAVSETAKGKRYVKIVESGDKSCVIRDRLNDAVGILPIAEGCLGGCGYCQTKLARGRLRSYDLDQLVKEASSMVADGVSELWVTAQDTGAYGLDIGSDLPTLLKSISEIGGDYRLRVGMMNPNHAIDMLEQLIEAFSSEKIYRFLHLPVQSGDDGVLKDMGRGYTVDDFMQVVDAFEGYSLSTDVIVGYPTEDEKAFQKTVKLVEDVKPDVLNVSRYWPRPGTESAKLKIHPGRETKRRSRIMDSVFKRTGYESNLKWVGWRGKALVSHINQDGTSTARNDWYKPIIVQGGVVGEHISLEVVDCTYYDLRGHIV